MTIICTWREVEKGLKCQFKLILQEYTDNSNILSEAAQKDFLGLLEYICKSRKSFQLEASKFGLLKGTIENDNIEDNDKVFSIDLMIDVLLNICSSADSFPSEFAYFSRILKDSEDVDTRKLIALCIKYWPCEYPSVKESFIIPLAAKMPKLLFESPELTSLMRERLLCAHFEPFDACFVLLDLLKISPFDFVDSQLSTLKQIVNENQQAAQHEFNTALHQSGCHCD